VILLEGKHRVLPPYPAELSERAQHDLERLGVEVHLNAMVTDITRDGIYVSDRFMPARNVFWAAGVKASPLAESLGATLDRAGRVIVNSDLTVPGHPEVFVTGDLAAAESADTGEAVPGVAQAALQMGRYAGRAVARETTGRSTPQQRKPFVYHDKGKMAIIGKARAVAWIGRFKFGGMLAWLLWGGVHIAFLIGFRNRAAVMANWFWNWLINARDVRLITGPARLEVAKPRQSIAKQPTPARVNREPTDHQPALSSDGNPS
jgi:NADH dehydrogenase